MTFISCLYNCCYSHTCLCIISEKTSAHTQLTYSAGVPNIVATDLSFVCSCALLVLNSKQHKCSLTFLQGQTVSPLQPLMTRPNSAHTLAQVTSQSWPVRMALGVVKSAGKTQTKRRQSWYYHMQYCFMATRRR